jgi:hypothetical protein
MMCPEKPLPGCARTSAGAAAGGGAGVSDGTATAAPSSPCRRATRRHTSRIPPRTRYHLTTQHYAQLAARRRALRAFLRFSERAAADLGLGAQQYQAMLVVRGWADERPVTIGNLAEELFIKHNSAVGLVNRLVQQRFMTRVISSADRRKVELALQGGAGAYPARSHGPRDARRPAPPRAAAPRARLQAIPRPDRLCLAPRGQSSVTSYRPFYPGQRRCMARAAEGDVATQSCDARAGLAPEHRLSCQVSDSGCGAAAHAYRLPCDRRPIERSESWRGRSRSAIMSAGTPRPGA